MSRLENLITILKISPFAKIFMNGEPLVLTVAIHHIQMAINITTLPNCFSTLNDGGRGMIDRVADVLHVFI